MTGGHSFTEELTEEVFMYINLIPVTGSIS